MGFAGCALVRSGRICVSPEDGKLRLWIPTASAETIFVDPLSGVRTISATRAEDGTRLTVEISPRVQALELEARTSSSCRSARLRLEPQLPKVAELDQAERLRSKGAYAEAAERIGSFLAGPSPSPIAKARALALLARIELARGSTRAIARFQASIDESRAQGLLSQEVLDRETLAYVLTVRERRFRDARTWLKDLDRDSADFPEGRAFGRYYLALLARETGDLRTALRLSDEAAAELAHLGSYKGWFMAKELNATTLSALGRSADGLRALDDITAGALERADRCERARILANIGWVLLLAREEGNPPARDPRAPLEEALAIFRSACPNAVFLAGVLLNLAIDSLDRGDIGSARDYVQEASQRMPESDVRARLWVLDVEARIAGAEGHHAQALATYERLSLLADFASDPEARWRTASGRAGTLEELGRTADALASYAEADALADDQSLVVPLGEGRAAFLARRTAVSERAIALALRAGRTQLAFDLARRSRTRLLSALYRTHLLEDLDPERRQRWDAAIAEYARRRSEREAKLRAHWALSIDELKRGRRDLARQDRGLGAALDDALAVLQQGARAAFERPELARPQAEELFVVYHPVPGGYAVFAADSRRLIVRRVGTIDPALIRDANASSNEARAALSKLLLEPILGPLSRARRLRIMAAGPARMVDFHALRFGDKPLIERLPVSYALDLPPRLTGPTRLQGVNDRLPNDKTVLIAADPNGNLPEARREARALDASFREAGWSVRSLERDQATAERMRSALGSPPLLFHYAGHGVFAGHDGFESALPLAGDGRLTVGDILALGSVPAHVVLSGCDTAASRGDSAPEGLGLAQAFVVRGSEDVIAASRPVSDRLGFAVAARAHVHLRTSETLDLAEALRRAQLESLHRENGEDWAAFRTLTR